MDKPSFSPYEEIEHTADLALRVRGNTLQELFVNAARGMFYLMYEDELPEAAATERAVQLESLDMETLLVDWLNELLYLADAHQEAFSRVALSELQPTRLKAQVGGSKAARLKKVIKAATFHGLSIAHSDSGYTVDIIFDV